MKINLELNIPDDRTFLNFWNWYNGDDVVCRVDHGKLLLTQRDSNNDLLPEREITIGEFIEMVRERVDSWPK